MFWNPIRLWQYLMKVEAENRVDYNLIQHVVDMLMNFRWNLSPIAETLLPSASVYTDVQRSADVKDRVDHPMVWDSCRKLKDNHVYVTNEDDHKQRNCVGNHCGSLSGMKEGT